MLYISLFCGTFLLIFNYNYLLYIFYAYILKYIINICINDYYWMNSKEIYLNIFGTIIYMIHYVYFTNKDTYIIKQITNTYNFIYTRLYNINNMIDYNIKKHTLNYFINKKSPQNINNDIFNILKNYLILIKHIEDNNPNNELKQQLNKYKLDINNYLKKHTKKTTNILDDIKLYNN